MRLASIGQGLFARFYLYQLVIVGAALAAGLVIATTFGGAGRDRKAVIYIAQRTMRELDDRARLQRELDEMGRHLPVRVTVYDRAGQILARTGPPFPPVDAKSVARLATVDALDGPDGSVATGTADAYAVATLQLGHSGRNISLVIALLVVLALGNVPLVRSIAHPLEHLSRAAEAFGAGDMRARANLPRRDQIGDLARAFDTMADAVEAARMAEKELLANVSHELRTPLARIRVVHELAAEKFPDVAQRYMREIAEELGELERLLDTVIERARLDLQKAHGGQTEAPLALERFGVGMCIDDLALQFVERHPGRPIIREIDYELSVCADRRMLRRAIDNVLANADAYSAPERPIAIFVCKSEDGARAEIRIKDEGPGIAPEDLPHVGMPFFRTDRSRSRNTGGIGLGLSLSRRILESHRGSLSIQSSPDVGTTVTLSLPLTRA